MSLTNSDCLQRAATESILKKHYAFLKDIFIDQISQSSYPALGSLDFADFAVQCKFLDNDPNVNLSTIDRTFIAATLQVEGQGARESDIPADKLNRFEFMEILVRLANIKFIETKKIKGFDEATAHLIEDYIMPNYTPEPWQEFREKELWTIDVNDILEANQEHLRKIYNSFLSQLHKAMDLRDCLTACMHTGPIDVSEKDIALAYGMSKMTVVDELKHYKQYGKMEFVEWLEFIGRISDIRFRHSDMASIPLAAKIEIVLDDLLAGFGLVRNDVEIEVCEFSESDDDY